MAYGNFGTGTTTIDENSSFTLKQTNRNGSYATWYSYGKITLNNNSSLIIINDFPNITSSNYNISFQSSSSGFILNKPNKVLLYNTTANVIATSATIPFSFTYSRLNLFTTPLSLDSVISTTNLPTYSWYKESLISEVSGTFNSTTTTITSNNYTATDTATELEELPALTNLNFPNKKAIFIGTLPLVIASLTDLDTTLKGRTSSKASILISYDNTSNVVIADEKGDFTYLYDEPLPIGTKITLTVK